MDETLLSSPTVKDTISNGRASITGISIGRGQGSGGQDQPGSLPFPSSPITCLILSPKLGSNALGVMVRAGEVAFALGLSLHAAVLPAAGPCRLHNADAAGLRTAPGTLRSPVLADPAGLCGHHSLHRHGVDANVIISERIREEMRAGKNAPKSHRPGLPEGVSPLCSTAISPPSSCRSCSSYSARGQCSPSATRCSAAADDLLTLFPASSCPG